MACRESFATTYRRYKAMTLTKIGTVKLRRSLVCEQPSDGVTIRSCPLYPVGSSDGYRRSESELFRLLIPILITIHKRKRRQPSLSSSMRYGFMGERGAGWRLSSQPTRLTRRYHPKHGNLPLDAYMCVERQEPCLNSQMIKTAHAYIVRWLN